MAKTDLSLNFFWHFMSACTVFSFRKIAVIVISVLSFPAFAEDADKSKVKTLEDPRYLLMIIENQINSGQIKEVEVQDVIESIKRELETRKKSEFILKETIQILEELLSSPGLVSVVGPIKGTLGASALSISDTMGLTNQASKARKLLIKLNDRVYDLSLLKNEEFSRKFKEKAMLASNPLYNNEHLTYDQFFERAHEFKIELERDLIILVDWISWDARAQKYYRFKEIGVKEYISKF